MKVTAKVLDGDTLLLRLLTCRHLFTYTARSFKNDYGTKALNFRRLARMSKALKNIVVDLVVIVQVEGPSNDESI